MINPCVFVGKPLSSEDPVFKLSPKNQSHQIPQAQLTILRGSQVGMCFWLSIGMNLFGRIEGRLLRDVLASRRHMQIYHESNFYILDDLQSTNGTFVNGKPITQSVQLQHGDVIRVGETILVFEILGEEPVTLGYGAAPVRFVDNRNNETTLTTRDLADLLADQVKR